MVDRVVGLQILQQVVHGPALLLGTDEWPGTDLGGPDLPEPLTEQPLGYLPIGGPAALADLLPTVSIGNPPHHGFRPPEYPALAPHVGDSSHRVGPSEWEKRPDWTATLNLNLTART